MHEETLYFTHIETPELPFDLPHGEFESPAQEEDYWADFSILEDISEDR